MRDKPTDAFRIGRVSAIFPERCTAEVTFEDRGDTVSQELFIIVPFTLKDQAYYMPSVQDRVACYFDPGAPNVGYIFGSFFSDTRPPLHPDENKVYMQFEDKTLIEYDKKAHKLTINVPEGAGTSVEIVATGDIAIKSGKSVNIEAATSIALKAPSLAIESTVEHTGDINTSGTHTDSVGKHS